MNDTTAGVQREMALTRERMSETIAELDAQISQRVAQVKGKVDLVQLAQEHPWPALAVAFGLGALLSTTGADRKAARATVQAVKAAPGTTAELARRGVDGAKALVRRDGDDDDRGNGAGKGVGRPQPGLTDRMRGTLTRAIGLDELIGQMRDAAAELGRPASYAGQNVPRNTGQQM